MKFPIIVVGPMYANKTTYILEECVKNKGLMLKPSIDTRYSTNTVTNHSKDLEVNAELIDINMPYSFYSLQFRLWFVKYTHLYLDEFQFYSVDFIDQLIQDNQSYDCQLVFAGLDKNWKGEEFPTYTLFSQKYRLRHHEIYKTGTCAICGGTSRMTGKISGSNEIYEVGGDDKYIPVCEKCHKELYQGK